MFSRAQEKTSGRDREGLEQMQLRYLGQEGECLAWHRLWPEYDELLHSIQKLLSSSSHWVEAQPSLAVTCLEQSHSVTMLREKLALQDMMREEEIVDRLNTLSCSNDEIQVTPDVSRKASSRIGNFVQIENLY